MTRPSIAHLLLLAIPFAIVGCAAPRPDYSVRAHDPTEIIPAIRIAVRARDQSVVPDLIKNLDSDDPAVRFYSNDGLKKLTGQDFGYLYYADDLVREPAVRKWQAWLANPSSPDSKTAALSVQGPTTHAVP
ncbi:MAG: hypothetical protein JO353_06865 [Phycisphaerae bacterium]|nr:hypothetical protein [Phycisphaerae bacterium]